MPNMSRLVIPAAAIGLLAACTDVRTVSDYHPSYNYSDFANYHQNRDTRVTVHGNPFSMEDATFGSAVTDRMQGRHAGTRTNFTVTPVNAARNYWVVMAFDAQPADGDMCTATAFNSRPASPGNMVLRAAWCFDGRKESDVWVYGRDVEGVDDGTFDRMVAAATHNLFPRFEDRRRRDAQESDDGGSFPDS